MAIFYVDFSNGKNPTAFGTGGLGMSPNDPNENNRPWRSLQYFTQSGTRVPGDICYVSGGTQWIKNAGGTSSNNSLLFTNDGNIYGGFISIVGGYPGKPNQNRPIVNFGRTSSNAWLQDDNYWRFTNIEFKNSTFTTYGNMRIGNTILANSYQLNNCRFSGSKAYSYPRGLYLNAIKDILISSCQFFGNMSGSRTGAGLYIYDCMQ
jgi:hypothetical protein